ncbi:sulfatase family protein [Aquimarina algicola]|uniref:sulfatase family protein n=1 Tax=Aquimarina algicola TaxID=2589995 RepID=UPI0029393DAE|nr:sulfatase [Aquimarina algicola]
MFKNAFCTNSICTPSRANIITGQYSQTNGVLDLHIPLKVERQYLPIEMKKLGYQTAVIGKWHLKKIPENFDYYNILPGQGKYFDPVLTEIGETNDVDIPRYGGRIETIKGRKHKGHSSDVITDLSLEWLKNKRDKSKPFLLLHHFKAPHAGFDSALRYDSYLENEFIPEPASLYDNKNNGSIATKGVDNSLIDTIGSSVGRRHYKRRQIYKGNREAAKKMTDKEYKSTVYQNYLKRYLRCVKGVDDNIKRLLDYLEKTGELDNTVVIYTGDQGFMLGEHDYIDKRWMYEESLRMPFLVRYPKLIQAGSASEAIVNNVDYAPTILDLAGGKTPEYMQGESFKYVLANKGKEPKGWKQSTYYRYWMHMYSHFNPAHFGIRTKRYKLIFFYGLHYNKKKKNNDGLPKFQTPAAWEFYDLKNDPEELDNKYADPKYSKIIQKLKAELKEQRKQYNEEDQKYPHLQEVISTHWND